MLMNFVHELGAVLQGDAPLSTVLGAGVAVCRELTPSCREEAEVRWTLPGEEGSAGQGPTLTEESLADAKQGRGSCGCKVTHRKAFTEEFAGAICIKKIGSVLLSGGKETAVCVTATPH